MSPTTTDTRTPSADAAEDGEDYEDGPPAMGVLLLLAAFMLGMYVASLLWLLR